MTNTDPPSTPEHHRYIRRAAIDRVGYLLWLADRLESEYGVDRLIRKDAAAAIRQFLEDVK